MEHCYEPHSYYHFGLGFSRTHPAISSYWVPPDMETPKLDSLFHGKSQSTMDDLGVRPIHPVWIMRLIIPMPIVIFWGLIIELGLIIIH